MFTKSVPSTMKMTVKGGAAVDPDSGISRYHCYESAEFALKLLLKMLLLFGTKCASS